MCKEVKPFLQAFELAPAGSVYRSALVSFYARQGVTRSKSRTEKSNSSGAKPKTWDQGPDTSCSYPKHRNTKNCQRKIFLDLPQPIQNIGHELLAWAYISAAQYTPP
jgi:hypothetical protein